MMCGRAMSGSKTIGDFDAPHNKSTNSPKEPLNLPAVDATTVLPEGKSKIQGAENILSPANIQQVLQEMKKQCESPFYRASNPETCSKIK